MASVSPSSTSSNNSRPSVADLTKQWRSHEVAIAELNNLPSSRAVYQKNGNLFFRTTIQTATTMEQRSES
ncbi:Prefoldin [Sesbania bispinosa]|nr:Prefoldin [Sesbania bispinosa]